MYVYPIEEVDWSWSIIFECDYLLRFIKHDEEAVYAVPFRGLALQLDNVPWIHLV